MALNADDVTKLATFDGAEATTWKWHETNDPVMGGKSVGSFTVDSANKKGVFNGTCAIVPFLKAPGFCNAISELALFKHFPDASAFINGSMYLQVRSDTADYKGFKVGWGAKDVPKKSRYGAPSFKAPFMLTPSTDWQLVKIPFNKFSDDWSGYTGECGGTDPDGTKHRCCSAANADVCPTAKFLATITNVEIWAEGAEGNFHLEVQWIGAGAL